jgi:flagellar protein FliS
MMQPSDAYFETQVLTAKPQQLRLMLLDGAIRFADQTAQFGQEEKHDAGLESLIRCRDIVSELIAGIRPDASPLAQKVLGLYIFLFKALTEAQLSRDRLKLAHVRRILEAERETWQQICRQLPEAPIESAATEIVAPAIVQPAASELSDTHLSLEA